jgi:hypothetical protein
VLAVSLTLSVRSRGALAVFGWWRLALMAVALGLAPVVFAVVSGGPEGGFGYLMLMIGVAALILVGPVACAVVVLWLEGDRSVRRRAVALLVPAAIGTTMHLTVLPARLPKNVFLLLTEYLPVSDVEVVDTALPVLGFLVALLVIRWRERPAAAGPEPSAPA